MDYWVNLLLITLVVAVHSRRSFVALVRTNTIGTIIPFALMASAALMLVVLWQRSAILSAALVGPLLAISLYQRSTYRALRAMRLALTDPLTGLGNHRHFHERLQRELVAAEDAGQQLSLCLVDIDDFKRINDQYGHPTGDRVLSQIATRLRQGGEAFRLGGDEFAVLLADHDEAAAFDAATSIVERLREMDLDHAEQVTVSAGVATFPVQGVGRDELDPLRGQRPLLGEGAREEPRAQLPARGRRAGRAEEARGRRRSRCALPRRRQPRARGRRARRLRGQPLRARRRARGAGRRRGWASSRNRSS